MRTANWYIEYTYFDEKTGKELLSSINIFHDEKEEPYGTLLLKPIQEKWNKVNYKGDIESVRVQSAKTI